MLIGLVIILLLTLLLPLVSKKAEQNLEVFLFIMGLSASLISKVFSSNLLIDILQNKFMYMITIAVFIGGIFFKIFRQKITKAVQFLIKNSSLKLFIFFMIIVLSLLSSVITAIIASLILVEIINVLPVSRKNKINLTIVACFGIGFGAVLTPVGEPLSTVVISKLNTGFWFLLQQLGALIFPGILLLGIMGTFFTNKNNDINNTGAVNEEESYSTIIIRTAKILLFVMALELLGTSYKIVIDTYIVMLDERLLYWVNIISAILDNATLAAAEISNKMSIVQIKAVLIGLLISGGMMVPGNIPNIISADKLKIRSSEWVKLGIPLGFVLLISYYILLFYIL